jgi:hypothetical protein
MAKNPVIQFIGFALNFGVLFALWWFGWFTGPQLIFVYVVWVTGILVGFSGAYWQLKPLKLKNPIGRRYSEYPQNLRQILGKEPHPGEVIWQWPNVEAINRVIEALNDNPDDPQAQADYDQIQEALDQAQEVLNLSPRRIKTWANRFVEVVEIEDKAPNLESGLTGQSSFLVSTKALFTGGLKDLITPILPRPKYWR